MTNKKYLCVDVGEKRLGIAMADSEIRLAFPLLTLDVDGTEIEKIHQLIDAESIDELIVGYPRNQSGEPTKQTEFVENFVESLNVGIPLKYQDESLTSVAAEEQLKAHGKPYAKADIDKIAASIILQDYLEATNE